jgi:hypothetical protein
MKRCAVCDHRVFWSTLTDKDDSFCGYYCYTYSEMPGFCAKCSASTTDEAPGNTIVGGLFGSVLLGAADRCATCHSIVQRLRPIVFAIPITRGTPYRVIYTNSTTYVGRRLKE